MVLFTDSPHNLWNVGHGDRTFRTSVLRGADHCGFTGSFLLYAPCHTESLRSGKHLYLRQGTSADFHGRCLFGGWYVGKGRYPGPLFGSQIC